MKNVVENRAQASFANLLRYAAEIDPYALDPIPDSIAATGPPVVLQTPPAAVAPVAVLRAKSAAEMDAVLSVPFVATVSAALQERAAVSMITVISHAVRDYAARISAPSLVSAVDASPVPLNRAAVVRGRTSRRAVTPIRPAVEDHLTHRNAEIPIRRVTRRVATVNEHGSVMINLCCNVMDVCVCVCVYVIRVCTWYRYPHPIIWFFIHVRPIIMLLVSWEFFHYGLTSPKGVLRFMGVFCSSSLGRAMIRNFRVSKKKR